MFLTLALVCVTGAAAGGIRISIAESRAVVGISAYALDSMTTVTKMLHGLLPLLLHWL